jgi:hypothetical protein
MTDVEINRFIKKNFLDGVFLDFSIYRNLLYRNSVDGVLTGFYFEKSSSQSNGIYIWSFAQPLFIPNDSVVLTFGRRIRNSIWIIKDNPLIENDLKEMKSLMDREFFDYLSKIDSSSGFYEYFGRKSTNLRMIEGVVHSGVSANRADVKGVLANFIDALKSNDMTIGWVSDLHTRMLEIYKNWENRAFLSSMMGKNIQFTKDHIGI